MTASWLTSRSLHFQDLTQHPDFLVLQLIIRQDQISIACQAGAIQEWTEDGVRLQDGTELQADLVVQGLGYDKAYSYFSPALLKGLHVGPDGLHLYRNIVAHNVPVSHALLAHILLQDENDADAPAKQCSPSCAGSLVKCLVASPAKRILHGHICALDQLSLLQQIP